MDVLTLVVLVLVIVAAALELFRPVRHLFTVVVAATLVLLLLHTVG